MEKLSRQEAIEIAGIELVEQVENMSCEATSRLIYPSFEPEHVGMQEFCATAKNNCAKVTAYYFQKDEDMEDCNDWSMLDWKIEYYEVELF